MKKTYAYGATLFALTSLWGSLPECRVVERGVHSCAPYPTRLLPVGHQLKHQRQREVIVEKTLPLPPPPKKPKESDVPLPVPVKVEAPKRFQGSETELPIVPPPVSKEPLPQIEVNKTTPPPSVKKPPVVEEKKETEDNLTQKQTVKVPQPKVTIELPKEENATQQKPPQTAKKAAGQTPKEPTKKETPKTVAPPPPKGIYIVKPGDTLSKIAWVFGVKTKEILALNNIKKKSHLKVKQKLLLPLAQERIDVLESGKYRVQSGDTLLGIAKKFSVDAKALKHFNHISKSDHLRIGEVLKLPLPHIVEKLKAEEKRKKLEEQKRKKRLAKARKRFKERKLLRQIGHHRLRVTATAYTSHRGQTDKTPFLAAWNNRIRPGMKIVAVSRDLLYKYGLKNGTPIRISGLPGVYRVRDKMNKRYRRRIDIYMGMNRRKALRWGRRSVVISW